jgi:hypothetical protein
LKKKLFKKIKLQSNFDAETVKSLKIQSSENDKYKINDDKKEYEINTKPLDVSHDNNSDIINEDNIININEKEEKNFDNNLNSNNKFISQNFFDKNKDNNKKINLSNKKLEKGKIKKIYLNITEEDKRVESKDKNKQSEKTTKSVISSILDNKTKYRMNYLITENGLEEKVGNNSIKSNDELLSNNKSKKIDEKKNEEEEEVEYEEVEDEYDEKIKDDNNGKIINNINVIMNNNNVNNSNMKDNQVENVQKIKSELNAYENNVDNQAINCIILDQNNNNIYKACYICEHIYNLTKFFVPECNEHFICKKCAKTYYEELIEDGVKELLCPFLKCKAPIITDNLKDIISQEHFKRLDEHNNEDNANNNNNDEKGKSNFIFTKLNINCNEDKIQLYTKKHVIDINSNKNFFDYNKGKEGYCPFCFEKSLFSKTNARFYKCLNCLRKICKCCFKEFNDRHIDINYIYHCKVYYRNGENEKKIKMIIIFLRQLFFVIASFYLMFPGCFYFFSQIFLKLLNVKKNNYIFNYIIGYFFVLICFIISFPFIVLLLPYFPSIMALCDY